MPAEPVKPVSHARRSAHLRHIFAVELVGTRHEKGVDAERVKTAAQQRELDPCRIAAWR